MIPTLRYDETKGQPDLGIRIVVVVIVKSRGFT
jgi:hypothetical protein